MGRRSKSTGGGGPLRTIERIGISRGIFGTSKGWMYLGGGLWTLRTVRRMAQRKSEVLLREELAPGQRLIIANGRATLDEPPASEPGRRRRRG